MRSGLFWSPVPPCLQYLPLLSASGTLHMLSLPPGMPFSFHPTRWLAPSSQLCTSLGSQFTCFSNFPPTYTPSPAWVTHCQCLQCLSPDSTVSTMRAGSCLFCLSFCSQYQACDSVYLAGAWNTVGTQQVSVERMNGRTTQFVV